MLINYSIFCTQEQLIKSPGGLYLPFIYAYVWAKPSYSLMHFRGMSHALRMVPPF